MSIRTHYDNLQVSRNASDTVIRAAYKSLVQKYHPDKNPESREEAERITRIINEAFEVLSNPKLKKEHDVRIAANENIAEPPDRNVSQEPQQEVAQRRTQDPDLRKCSVDYSKFIRSLLLYFGVVLIVVGIIKIIGF
ncbi:MAG: DnaJ domain-containing protein [Thiobacillus sp.]